MAYECSWASWAYERGAVVGVKVVQAQWQRVSECKGRREEGRQDGEGG